MVKKYGTERANNYNCHHRMKHVLEHFFPLKVIPFILHMRTTHFLFYVCKFTQSSTIKSHILYTQAIITSDSPVTYNKIKIH